MSGVPQFLNMLVVVVFVTDVERGMDGTAVGIFTVKKRTVKFYSPLQRGD